MTLKTYIVASVLFFAWLFLMAVLSMFDTIHLAAGFMCLVPLFVVGRMLWNLGSRLKK